MNESPADRLSFWNARSNLGFAAGSGDTNLKELEISALRKNIGEPSTILDAGCGNGITLLNLASTIIDCNFFGFDYSQGMVDAANQQIKNNGIFNNIKICQASLLDDFPDSLQNLGVPKMGFDCIYTERSIINLDSFDQQAKAVQSLWNMVASGGRLILCEAFLEGLEEINNFRSSLGLEEIIPPWHNRYLSLSELEKLAPTQSSKPRVVEFSGSYYFVSRIIHARDAFLDGRQPSYDASINKQSLDLPPIPLCGQSKIVIFEK